MSQLHSKQKKMPAEPIWVEEVRPMHYLVIQFNGDTWDGVQGKGVERLINGTLLELGLPPQEFKVEGRTVHVQSGQQIHWLTVSHSSAEVLERISKVVGDALQNARFMNARAYQVYDSEDIRLMECYFSDEQRCKEWSADTTPLVIPLIGKLKRAMMVEPARSKK